MAAPIFLTTETPPDNHIMLWLFVAAFVLAALWRRRPRVDLAGKWGRVYIFELTNFPGHYKIGRTGRATVVRQAEVESDMLGGQPTRLIFTVNVPFSNSVEDLAHQYLRPYRYRCAGTIEMFRCSEWRAIRAVQKAARDVKRAAGWRISPMDRKIAWQIRRSGKRERLF